MVEGHVGNHGSDHPAQKNHGQRVHGKVHVMNHVMVHVMSHVMSHVKVHVKVPWSDVEEEHEMREDHESSLGDHEVHLMD